jgi:Glycosyltransferase family 87/WD40-like Beta Propeller Repeat
MSVNKATEFANEIRPTERMSPVFRAVEWALASVLLFFFIADGIVPGWRALNTDFPNYYLTAALRLNHDSVDRAYEWIWFQRHKDHREIAQPLVGYVPNPPLCAVPILPVGWLPALPAKRAWIVLNLMLLASSLWILRRVTQLPWRRIILLTLLCVLPLRTDFAFGQYYIVILFLICAAYFAIVRNFNFAAGILLAAAAWFKLFPAVFLILFLRKRDGRAIAGLITGLVALGAVSLFIFGLDMHWVWLIEVLPRALRGDLVGPYVLKWSSFTSLWHRLFLYEPELNPAPVISSALLYSVAQALTGTALLFAFLFRTNSESDDRVREWEWAAFVPLLLLLSSMPGPYHYCVLIFSAILGVDFLLRAGKWRASLLFAFLYALACANLPEAYDFDLRRLLATFAFYVVLLWNAPARAGASTKKRLWILASVVCGTLIVFNIRPLRDRAEDFPRRLASTGTIESYASTNPIATKQGVVSIEMVGEGYRAVNRSNGQVLTKGWVGDVLTVAGSRESAFTYFEFEHQGSHIFRVDSDQAAGGGSVPEYVSDGQQPAISGDGRWLAFLREDRGRYTILTSRDGLVPGAVAGGRDVPGVLEITVKGNGDIIAAMGGAGTPHLALLRNGASDLRRLDEIAGTVRYPSMSPDSRLLAFSRREAGSWHLFVRDLASGKERRLTRAACNATSPSWNGPNSILYATDCGRGLGLGAIDQIDLPSNLD